MGVVGHVEPAGAVTAYLSGLEILESLPQHDRSVAAPLLQHALHDEGVAGEDDLSPALVDTIEHRYFDEAGFVFESKEDYGLAAAGGRALAGDHGGGPMQRGQEARSRRTEAISRSQTSQRTRAATALVEVACGQLGRLLGRWGAQAG